MEKKKKKCKTCGELKYIWSRAFGCRQCHMASQSVTSTKKTPIKQISNKQSKSNAQVSRAKAIVIQYYLDKFGYMFCSSCGTSQGRIHCSHLVPIGYNKELEAVVDNILLQCPECHSKWENTSEGIKQFNNLQDILDRVKKLDISYYNRIISKL